MPRDDVTLLDIAKAGYLVTAFAKDMTKEAFLADVKTQSSVLYQLAVIGEAVRRLSSEFRAQHPEIP